MCTWGSGNFSYFLVEKLRNFSGKGWGSSLNLIKFALTFRAHIWRQPGPYTPAVSRVSPCLPSEPNLSPPMPMPLPLARTPSLATGRPPRRPENRVRRRPRPFNLRATSTYTSNPKGRVPHAIWTRTRTRRSTRPRSRTIVRRSGGGRTTIPQWPKTS